MHPDVIVVYLSVASLRDGVHVKQLTGVVLNPGEHHHGDGVAFFLDYIQDILGS